MIKPAEEEGGDGEREEEVGVKKSKALDIAENERISLKEVSVRNFELIETLLLLLK